MIDVEMKNRLSSLKCPVCEEKRYEFGQMSANGIYFHREDEGLLKKAFGIKLSHRTLCRRCLECGNAQIFFPDD